jgi:hypothetical protein
MMRTADRALKTVGLGACGEAGLAERAPQVNRSLAPRLGPS